MEIKMKLIEIIDKRISLKVNDDNSLKSCWKQEINVLTHNLADTMKCLDGLDSLHYKYVSEVFDDISGYFQSKELIECMKNNAIRTGVDCATDIDFAIKAMNTK